MSVDVLRHDKLLIARDMLEIARKLIAMHFREQMKYP